MHTVLIRLRFLLSTSEVKKEYERQGNSKAILGILFSNVIKSVVHSFLIVLPLLISRKMQIFAFLSTCKIFKSQGFKSRRNLQHFLFLELRTIVPVIKCYQIQKRR